MKLDAMYGLEHGTEDRAKLKARLPGLHDIERAQSKWKDDYELNTQARNMFRVSNNELYSLVICKAIISINLSFTT